MSKRFFNILALIIVVMIPAVIQAQNNTSSAYSKFGLGDLANVGYGKNLALGGTGIGLRDATFLNQKNPASLTAIDTLSFLFETGVHGRATWSSTSDRTQLFWDGNLTHVSLGHRITSWLMASAGVMPYSNVGYNIKTTGTANVENSVKQTLWGGTGGVNKLYYALGLKINKNFSLGAEGSFLYGPMNEERNTYFFVANLMGSTDEYTSYLSQARYHGFSVKGGLQYTANLDKKGTILTIGGVFSPATKLTGKSDVTITQYYSGLSTPDSVYNESNVRAEPITIPMMYGGGFSFTWRGKYMIAADYETNTWSENILKQYIDQQIYSVGFEMLPRNSFKYFEKCAYRIGFRYDDGYVRVKGIDIQDMRLSLGVGLPIYRSKSMANVSLELGQRGTTSMGLINERYTKLTVALSFHDYWFVKRKFD
jgi:hypothetical protein